jgi:NAD(P)-dependent dehydrogenase (short-subunit alcohol dehydrogenase family)
MTYNNHFPSHWFGRRSSPRNHLIGKVVMLVGEDTTLLQGLAEPLARKGADIAVVCPTASPELVRPLRESVESAGQRFYQVTAETAEQPERIVDTITAELGHLDIFIDLSAHAPTRWGFNGNGAHDDEERGPDWPLAQAALETITAA